MSQENLWKSPITRRAALLVAAMTLLLGGCGTSEESATTPTVESSGAIPTTSPVATTKPGPPRHQKSTAGRRASKVTAPVLGSQTKFHACQIQDLLPHTARPPGHL